MNSTPTTQTQSSTDEISLLELWQILVRRKQWILLTLAVCVAAALAFIYIKAPVYEASVKLRIGQVAGTGLFEPAEELSARLLSQYGEDVADGVKRERPFLARAAAQKNVAATVELVAEGDRPEDAVALLNRIFEGVQKSHFESYSQNVQFLTERLQNLDKQRAAFQQQYEDTSTMLDRLSQRDPTHEEIVLELLAGARTLEKTRELLVLVARPNAPGFVTSDNRVIPSTRLRASLDSGASTVVIPRDEAVAYGLCDEVLGEDTDPESAAAAADGSKPK